MKISRTHFFILAAVNLLLFFTALSHTSLWDNDEPTYAEIAKEMVKTGNWLTPMFNHQPWFCHPPLYMWLTAFAFKAFGWNEVTARFFPCLFALIGVFVVYRFAAHFWDRKTGLLAALILATSLQYLIQGRMATMDTILNTSLLVAFYAGWRALTEKTPRWDYASGLGRVTHKLLIRSPMARKRPLVSLISWYGFFLACAIATLAKGVFGLAYPLFIFAVYLLASKQWNRWKEIPWLPALCLYFIISAPWFIYETALYRNVFLYQVFYFYTFKRVVTPILRQSGPIYYYVPVLLFGFFPWSGFLPSLAVKGWNLRKDPKVLFVSLWALTTFLFFTLVNTKLPNYIFFLYPPLAMLLAHLWFKLTRREFLIGNVFTFLILGLLAYGLRILILQKVLQQELQIHVLQIYGLLAILGAGVIAAFLAEWLALPRSLALYALAAAMGLFWLTSLVHLSPVIESYKPMKPLALALKSYAKQEPASIIAFHVPAAASLVFYADAPVTNVENADEFLTLWKGEKAYSVLREKDLKTLSAQMHPYWPLAHRQTLWLVANFKPKAP